MRESAAALLEEMNTADLLPDTVQSEIHKVLKTRQGPVQDDVRQYQDYLQCSRSVRMWPVEGSGAGLKLAASEFMKTYLEMEVSDIDSTVIDSISRAQQLPRSKVKNEVIVIFARVEHRDLVYAHARNLANHQGKAGIRLEIPQHLRPEFKLLEAHGNMIRTTIGPAVKRSIRYSDSDCSLILNLRLSPDLSLIHI